MSDSFQKILILAPHTDDGEFGCGASINKWVEEGKEVYYATFSACKQSVLPQFPEDILDNLSHGLDNYLTFCLIY